MVALCQESPHDNGKEPDVTFFFRHWRENSLYVASAGPQHPDFGRFRGPAHGLIDKAELSWTCWRKVIDWQAVGLHRQSNSRNSRTCSGFEVTLLVSFLITLLCHFCFNGLKKKKAEKEKPIDEDLADSTGLMEKLRKRRSTEGVREPDVYDSVRGFAFFKHAFAMRILWWRRKHMTLGSQIFFHQPLEARNTQTTVTLDCEWSVGKKEEERKKKSKKKTPD